MKTAQRKSHRIRIHQHGSPEVLRYEEFDLGEPGPGEVRLRQEAIGVNFVDTMFRDGTFAVPLPFDLGVEGAGTVEAVGPGVQDFRAGDRVGYFFAPGAYADARIIGADALLKLPPDVTYEGAASILSKGMTAWMLLRRAHRLQAGETVLVHGAAGGIGTLVTRWAKRLGAVVIATVGSVEKMDGLRRHGIEHILSTDDPKLVEKVREISGGQGVDVVYESVGKATFERSVAALRDGGSLIHVGNASGQPGIDHAALAARSIRYLQPSTPQYVTPGATQREAGEELFAAFRAGVFGEFNVTRYPLADALKAHQDLAARRIVGAAILLP